MANDLKLRLYNTLTRTKEDFVPLDPRNVRMYVCGPTVYDFAHIGNARPAIVFDVLFRLLKHLYPGPGTAIDGSRVTYVRNITDVDDKINARAARDWPDLPLNDAIRKVTETTAAQYFKDTAALGCLEPTVQPRATDNIAGMQKLIGQLLGNGHAYEAPSVGEVLFDVNSMPDYGALSGRELANNLAGARIEVDAHKHNAADFVLWKRSSDSEPGWDSPWGRGRPGWHIECSAMSERYLGEVFDIHAGGLDLIFPHHENEIAQSRCAHGTDTMARYWLHNGFLQVEGQKMSKSLGNFFTINELLDGDRFGGRPWHGAVLRLVMLKTHYRQPIDWTVAKLVEARKELFAFAFAVEESLFVSRYRAAAEAGSPIRPDSAVLDALADDLNTPVVVRRLHELARAARSSEEARGRLMASLEMLGLVTPETVNLFNETYLFDPDVGPILRAHDINDVVERLRVAAANGEAGRTAELVQLVESWSPNIRVVQLRAGHFDFESATPTGDGDRIAAAINERLAAFAAKDFKRADEIRAALLAEGIQLMDSKNDAGERVTKWEIKR